MTKRPRESEPSLPNAKRPKLNTAPSTNLNDVDLLHAAAATSSSLASKLNQDAAPKKPKINLDALKKKMQSKMELLKKKKIGKMNTIPKEGLNQLAADVSVSSNEAQSSKTQQQSSTVKHISKVPPAKPKIAFKLKSVKIQKKETTSDAETPVHASNLDTNIFGTSSSSFFDRPSDQVIAKGDHSSSQHRPSSIDTLHMKTETRQSDDTPSSNHKKQPTPDSIDTLDAFMATLTEESQEAEVATSQTDASSKQQRPLDNTPPDDETFKRELLNAFNGTTPEKDENLMSDDDEDDDFFDSFVPPEREVIQQESILIGTRNTKKDLKQVDHSKMHYHPFRKDFFITPPEIAKTSPEQIKQLRKEKGNIKIRGKNCPPPILHFRQCGLTESLVDLIEEEGYEEPFPIQAQAIPAIMSGRDTIGIARTGSGKTLAFLLPMYRHVLDQPPLKTTDGPIALIIAPTRELAVQIHSEVEKFASVVNLSSMCAVGGAPISEQIAALKRGAHIVVCTPGRMIELLCANRGRVTNLKRVTYVCLDEADRMFDLGFGPQITRIIGNIRPNKQVVMFSATFPKPLEALARNAMATPVEITAGGRSIASKNVKQYVEIRKDKKEKFFRLLELLGYWHSVGRILIFVDRQSECGVLFKELTNAGYDVLVQHGGMDQLDRAFSMESFKSGEKTILIATSVLSRGLDVKGLELVINYDCPNHYEDYVHRVGRTGRAGKKGTAYTFITPDESAYASNMVRALKLSGNAVPQDLKQLADDFQAKNGKKKKKLSGYGGHGFKFDKSEQDQKKMEIQRQLVSLGEVEAEVFEKKSAPAAELEPQPAQVKQEEPTDEYELVDPQEAVRKAREYAMQLALEQIQGKEQKVHTAEIDINDFPQKARSEITSREYSFQLNDRFGVTVSTRGVFVPPGNPVPEGETKLHLLLEGHTKEKVERAKARIENTIRTVAAGFMQDGRQTHNVGRYSVVA